VGVFRDGPHFLSTPYYLRNGKVTKFKFGTHILSIDRYKSPLQISGKVTVGVVRTLEIFQGTHILDASRGRLCDSSAFLLLLLDFTSFYILHYSCVQLSRLQVCLQ